MATPSVTTRTGSQQPATARRPSPWAYFVRKAATAAALSLDGDEEATVRTGGVDLDDKFRPVFEDDLSNNLYCGSIAFLLHKLPFVQGITSARDIGETISKAVLEAEAKPVLPLG